MVVERLGSWLGPKTGFSRSYSDVAAPNCLMFISQGICSMFWRFQFSVLGRSQRKLPPAIENL
jgi:hypothetical protein